MLIEVPKIDSANYRADLVEKPVILDALDRLRSRAILAMKGNNDNQR